MSTNEAHCEIIQGRSQYTSRWRCLTHSFGFYADSQPERCPMAAKAEQEMDRAHANDARMEAMVRRDYEKPADQRRFIELTRTPQGELIAVADRDTGRIHSKVAQDHWIWVD